MDTDPKRIYPEISEQWSNIRNEVKGIFDTYVSRTPLVPAAATSVVSVGCGDFVEAQVLSDFFPNAEIVGYDADPVRIKLAKRVNTFPMERVSVEQGIVGRGVLKPSSADVVVVRNPDVHKEYTWEKAFQESIAALKPDGELIVTTLSEMEMERVRRSISGTEILIDEVHKKAGQISPAGLGDACVLIARKK